MMRTFSDDETTECHDNGDNGNIYCDDSSGDENIYCNGDGDVDGEH